MEHIVGKPLFVEFYGLPGCGKSTVSHQVAEQLRAEGYNVSEPSYELDRRYCTLLRKIRKLSIVIHYWLIHHKRYQVVSIIVKDNGYTGVSKIEQISNILQKIKIYQNTIKQQIVIWDQGLVQAAISLSLTDKLDAYENFERTSSLIPSETECVFVSIDIDERGALERMNARSTKDSRVEKLKDDNQKHQTLQRFQIGIDSISKQKKSIIVNGVDALENQVVKIKVEIQKVL